MNQIYDEPGVNVIIADNTVEINGKVEFGKDNRASEENFAANASITCPESMNLDVDILNPPCEWEHNSTDGTKTLRFKFKLTSNFYS